MPFIKTRSGINFNFEAATPDDIVLEDIAHALSHLCRFTGHCEGFYSVARHSVWCSQMAMHRSLDVQAQRWCLMHDAAEAYLGDVSSPLKSLLPDYRRLEDRVDGLIRSRFQLGEKPPSVAKIDREALEWEFEYVFDNRFSWRWDKSTFLEEARRLDIR